MAEEGFTIAGAEGFVGREIGVSPWRVVTQAMIDGFADSTADTYWIHTDPARAASGPFGGTIAHGFLTLSLLSVLLRESGVDWGDEVVGLNYGLDRVRFLTPVRAGERVRARIVLTPEPAVRLNKAIAMQGQLASGVNAALLLEGALGAMAHSSHNEYRESLFEMQRTEGVRAYLQMRDGPYQPEPMGPRSAKGRAAREAKE